MHYSKEDIAKAREMDLLTYLACYEPDNLRQVSANVYSTVEHDSLMINNGKWCWFSRGIGGRTALDYLIKVKGLRFPDAVARIIGNPTDPLPLSIRPPPETPKIFIMPEVASNPSRAFQYLVGRGIDPEIVQWCIDHRLIFETAKHGNVLFIGYDQDGNPKYGAVRSTTDSFKGDVKGSDKRFSFKIVNAQSPRTVHVFEAAIDLLSYATLEKQFGEKWLKRSYLSLAGIGSGKSIPKALEQFLKDYPEISYINLHLDNDEPGRIAAKNIKEALGSRYKFRDNPPPFGKDFNDFLLHKNEKAKQPKTIRR